MSNFLLMTAAADGHIAPCIPIVSKIVKSGHKVVWITGRQYQKHVEATGAKFHPIHIKDDPNGMEKYEFQPGLKNKKGIDQIKWYIKHIFLDACEREIEIINSVLNYFPADVLIGDTASFAIFFRSEMGGPPGACIFLIPWPLPSRDTAPFGLGILPGKNILARLRNNFLNVFVQHIIFKDINSYANKVRNNLGLQPLKEPLFYSFRKIISLFMQISTPAFEYPRSDSKNDIHFIGPVLLQREEEFQQPAWWSQLGGPEPVVLVNQGTIAKDLDDLIIPAINGLENEKLLVVAIPVQDGELSDIPVNVCVEPFVPFANLLPYVDVMVTNGGYGGTQLALSHGIPLVVAGDTEDKCEVAARVEWSGSGINLRKYRPSPKEIKKAVMEILSNPKYRKNAKRIQADFAKYDAPTKAVELLESLVHEKLHVTYDKVTCY